MKFSIPIFIILLFLQGCTTESKVPLKKSSLEHKIVLDTNKTYTDNEDEAFDDDTSGFDDEFEEEKEVVDPLYTYNTFMTSVNDTIFIYALNPISIGYQKVVPEIIQNSLFNAYHNIRFPIRFVNNLLQGKLKNTLDESERFLINSTVGIAGLFDPAKHYLQIHPHNEDFGQTLGYYGVSSGIHVVLPIWGPSNIRDIVGLSVDGYLSPILYQDALKAYRIPNNYPEAIALYGLDVVNKNALNLGAYESLKKDAIELYPFLRDIYEQKRTSDIED